MVLVSRTCWNGDTRNMRRVNFRQHCILFCLQLPSANHSASEDTYCKLLEITSWKRKNHVLNRHRPEVDLWEVSPDK